MGCVQELAPVVLTIWEVKIGLLQFQGQPGQNSYQDPISTNKQLGATKL
jgi:hypothetical protein